MSRRKGIKLPLALRRELGIETNQQRGRREQGNSIRGMREQRKAKRSEGRQHGRFSRPRSRQEFSRNGSDEGDASPPRYKMAKPAQRQADGGREELQPMPVLQRPKHHSPTLSEPSPFSLRSSSPGLVLDANSRAFKDRAAEDDADISALERRLGLSKNKTPKAFTEDGLDDLLDGLDEEERGVKRKAVGKEWLERKRRRAMVDGDDDELGRGEGNEKGDLNHDSDLELDISEDGSVVLGSDAISDVSLDVDLLDENAEQDEANLFEGFDSAADSSLRPQQKKVRENPYVPPVAPSTSTGKYIPPTLRKAQNSEGASLETLKRQLQGHLNKLSEVNLVSILGEVEKVYQSNPRQDVTSVLIDLLLALFCDRSALQNTFVILHAGFATALYKVIGVDFGAELLSQLVERFDQYHNDDAISKEALNLLSLLSNLFAFHMISSTIVFDHIRLLLSRLSEHNTELLLRLIRDCGPQLRQEDPSSLKGIVQMLQKETTRMNTAGEQMSVRTKFIIETITDLKNNKMKAATNNAGLASEHITLMRRVLGSLNGKRNVRAVEPLRITRDDIHNSDKRGKWWLVGASWKGNETGAAPDEIANVIVPPPDQLLDDDSIDLLTLSRQYGMNTDVRRSIFIALLSAVDHQDGHMRLLKLRLKRNQEQEVPKVLLRCAAGEKPYNHYYTLVAKKLCLDKKMRKAFQFALWAFFRRLGEHTDADEDDDGPEGENVEMSEVANLARLYAHLVLDGAISLDVLRVLDLISAEERTIMFVELLMAIIFIESKDKPSALAKVLERPAEGTSQMVKRLRFFIKNNVRTSDLIGKKEQKAVKQGCQVALETLKRLQMVAEATDV